jgi:hypothetical protein
MTERVLRFPADDQVARIYAYRGDTCVVNAPARGEVRVPHDSEVHLHPLPPVRGLYELAPDAIHRIELLKKSGTDDDLRHLSHLTGLRALRCSKSHAITDAGIAHIAGLRELRDLDLYWTSVTDASLATIGAMHHLTHLHLGDAGSGTASRGGARASDVGHHVCFLSGPWMSWLRRTIRDRHADRRPGRKWLPAAGASSRVDGGDTGALRKVSEHRQARAAAEEPRRIRERSS